MFDHVTIRVSDRSVSEPIYDALFEVLGTEKTIESEHFSEWVDFSVAQMHEGQPLTRRLHVGFVAPSHDEVDAFHARGLELGLRSDGAPGPRPQYRDDYYGAFLLDPDGNSIEAVHHGGMHGGGIDHLWLRVADVDACATFYDELSSFTGFIRAEESFFVGPGASFTLVEGEPSEHVHMAFPATENATVDGFHAAGLAAGGADNGGPGERANYHPGYYAAFIIDPAGHNIEVVNHNR